MLLQIPDYSLIVLVGCSGSGKSTFAARHFRPTEVLSCDAFRGWVSDDETCLEATGDAFEALHYLASIRLRRRKTVVVDATNVQMEARKPLLQHCWPVSDLKDYRLAPFHLLATEGKTYFDRDHGWHAAALAKLAEHSSLLLPTESSTVDLLDESSQQAAMDWWRAYTDSGGEGMVVKLRDFIMRGTRGLAQPAVKVRGREYLRVIYGPDYTEPENLERLRQRSLATKRLLAAREFALGVEGLERFVRGEPLPRVHECAFAVLALESEPVDPRL